MTESMPPSGERGGGVFGEFSFYLNDGGFL
jgi:hypothetical protein